MVIIVSAVSLALFLWALFAFKGKWVQQQVAFLVIYLAGLTIVGELDVLLPIYFVVSVLPFVYHLRRISVFSAAVCVFFIVLLIYGLIMQNSKATIVSFIAKMWQFVVFFLVYDAEFTVDQSDYRKMLWIVVIVETVLAVYLILTNTDVDAETGLTRLVSNAQPITGNLSTAVLPVMVYYYIKNRADSAKTRRMLLLSLAMLVWIVLSGTRGYTLEFAATMALIYFDFFTNNAVAARARRSRFFAAFGLTAAAVLVVIILPGVLESMSGVLRLQSSVGIRRYENAAVLEFFSNAPLFNKLFGIGLGGRAAGYSAMNDALARQFALGMWDKTHYLKDSGALFHNLYANVLVCLGVVGIAALLVINIVIWRRITASCGRQLFARRTLHLFQLSFLVMNYYRWSAVCGIAEMIILVLILKRIRQENEEEAGKRLPAVPESQAAS